MIPILNQIKKMDGVELSVGAGDPAYGGSGSGRCSIRGDLLSFDLIERTEPGLNGSDTAGLVETT